MPWKLNLESNYTYTSTTCIRNLEPKWQNRTLHRNLITLFSHCFPMCSHCVRIVITLCSHCFTLFSRCSRSAFHLKAQSADRHRMGGKHDLSCASVTKWLKLSDCSLSSSFSQTSTRAMTAANMDILCFGDATTLIRPCVDCGLRTGGYCDDCFAAERMPNEHWADGQHTPLCSRCDNEHDRCHFCRGMRWCAPPPCGANSSERPPPP